MRAFVVVFAVLVTLLVVRVVQYAGEIDSLQRAAPAVEASEKLDETVMKLNDWFRDRLVAEAVPTSDRANELTVLRRLSLALFGSVPSLEEIRAFEADDQPERIDRWLVRMLGDTRYGDYFAERLARSLVGVEDGPFVIFRRDRLTAWLAEQIRRDESWSQITRDLISAQGLWTDAPAANFLTIARIDDEGFDENKLAGRTVRMFLGQRMDCAQCHDHPFDPMWKQQHFEGLAAFYCQTSLTFGGITDFATGDEDKPVVYKVVDPGKEESEAREIPAAVPFHADWLPQQGGLRERLAAWITHADNRRFERAIANRVWGLMFGKPWHEPVDDLPHPADGEEDALDLLGREFRSRGDRLSTLIRLIALSDVFQRSSESSALDEAAWQTQVKSWAVFPLVRLRPEQVIGSLFQAGHVRTIDQNSNPFVRLQKFGNENDFINEYGDLGDDELQQQAGTIPQALLRMNGRFTRDLSKVDLLTSPGQLLSFAPDNKSLIDDCFLTCLCRHASTDELLFYLERLLRVEDDDLADESNAAKADTADQTGPATENNPAVTKAEVVEDLFWTLFNSPEFSWNH